MDPWVLEVLRVGYHLPFSTSPPVSESPHAYPSYNPGSLKAKALEEELQALVDKSAVEPATPSPGYYSRMFVVQKESGAWRPIIDLSLLNKSVVGTKFHMETVKTVLAAVRAGDWMFSPDMKDA